MAGKPSSPISVIPLGDASLKCGAYIAPTPGRVWKLRRNVKAFN
jgi:hypothetical protein